MGVFWGLISAIGFGAGDFMAREVSVRLTPYRALFYMHFVSAALLLVVVVFDGVPSTVTLEAVGLGALLGAINTIGGLLLYRALAIGKISIVSPVISSFGGVALFLSLLAGDYIPLGGILSLILMLAGVVIVSIVREDPAADTPSTGLRGLPEALLCALALGLNFWGLQFVVDSLGPYIPTLIGRLMTVILLALLMKPMRQSIAVPPGDLWIRIGLATFITTIGEVAYNVGVQGTTPGIVAVLSSLFSPVTVLLALIFLHEKLARHQWVGVGIIFLATLLIGIFQNFG